MKHLQRLLELATEIDDVARALHRLIADLRIRALDAPPRVTLAPAMHQVAVERLTTRVAFVGTDLGLAQATCRFRG